MMNQKVCSHFKNTKNITSETFVYKDECTLCFDSNESAEGIYLCLHCFNGSCKSHGEIHFEKSQKEHCVTMIIGKKPMDLNEEIGTVKAKPTYEFSIVCLICGTIDKSDFPNYKKLTDSISNATNASDLLLYKCTNYGELKQCRHSIDLTQYKSPPKIDLNAAQCSQCDLNSSLWLCLTCGSLNCGRSNYDGTGGNGHGLKHFKDSAHPLTAKIGTFSMDGMADVFCYLCDDSVKNPFIIRHLKSFGITDFTKTEKNTKEMEMDMNRTHKWSSAKDCNKKLLQGPGLTGVINTGNSCYISSVLQVLMALPKIKSQLIENGRNHIQNCSKMPPDCLDCQLVKFSNGLNNGKYCSSPLKDGEPPRFGRVNVSMLKPVLCGGQMDYLSDRQQDSHLFLLFILNRFGIKTELMSEIGVSEWFSFALEYRTQCNKCFKVRYDDEDTNYITINSLDPSQNMKTPLEMLLKRTFGEETIEGYSCPSCKTPQKITRGVKLKSTPEILMFQVSRFDIVNGEVQKIEREIEVPEEIDISSFRGFGLKKTEKKFPSEKTETELNSSHLSTLIAVGIDEAKARFLLTKYKNNLEEAFDHMGESIDVLPSKKSRQWTAGHFKLFAFITHVGKSTHQGHYIAHLKKNEWVCFDDSSVYESDVSEASKAYILFYKAVGSE